MADFLASVLDFLFVLGVAWLLIRSVWRKFGPPRGVSGRFAGTPGGSRPETVRGEMARDPVCGMFVSTEVSHRLIRGKETLHFCSEECLHRFEKEVLRK